MGAGNQWSGAPQGCDRRGQGGRRRSSIKAFTLGCERPRAGAGADAGADEDEALKLRRAETRLTTKERCDRHAAEMSLPCIRDAGRCCSGGC